MPGMRTGLVAVLALLLPLAAAARPPAAAVSACLDTLHDARATVANGSRACRALQIYFGITSIGALDREGLQDLQASLPHPPPPDAVRLQPAQVAALAAALQPAKASTPPGFWSRLREHLLQWLRGNKAQQNNAPPDWLRWLNKLLPRLGGPGAEIGAALKLTPLLLAIALLVIIVIELRASGLLQRYRSARAPVLHLTAAAPLPPLHAVLAATPQAGRAAAMLRWLLAALRARGRLPADDSLTNQELANRLTAPADTQMRQFLALAEPAIYGTTTLDDSDAQTLAARARALAERP